MIDTIKNKFPIRSRAYSDQPYPNVSVDTCENCGEAVYYHHDWKMLEPARFVHTDCEDPYGEGAGADKEI